MVPSPSLSQVPLNEYDFSGQKLCNVQSQVSVGGREGGYLTLCMHTHLFLMQLERVIEKNYYLHRSARDGFRSYLLSYASHSLKPVFNVEQLDLQRVAKSFGFSTPPGISLGILLLVCLLCVRALSLAE